MRDRSEQRFSHGVGLDDAPSSSTTSVHGGGQERKEACDVEDSAVRILDRNMLLALDGVLV